MGFFAARKLWRVWGRQRREHFAKVSGGKISNMQMTDRSNSIAGASGVKTVPAALSADHWNQIAPALRRDMGVRTYDDWIKPLRFGEFCAPSGLLTLCAPGAFAANWITERYLDRITLALKHNSPDVRSVRIIPDSANLPTISSAKSARDRLEIPNVDVPVSAHGSAPADTAPRHGIHSVFDARQCFANFMLGKSNILARNAALRMAALEQPVFNPLFLQSTTGQGKTHLMNAMAQDFAITRPDANILYLSAEKFMLEFVTAMRAQDTMAFKSRIRAADMLLIDDLQFIIGKGATQEELLHSVDTILSTGKRLIVAADRAPHQLDGLDQRLLSRLSSGLVAEIDAPDLALRTAILEQRRALMPDVHVPEDVIDFLARNVTRNVRELEGAFNKLVGYASLAGLTVDMDLARLRLSDGLRSSRARITIDDIQQAVCAHYKLDRLEMSSQRRSRVVARPRQIAMYLAKTLTPRSYPEIGRKFGGRDHSTVIHAIRTIENLRSRDGELDADIARIRRVLEL